MPEAKEQQAQREDVGIPKIRVRYCKHSESDYSLSLDVEEGHMVESTSHRRGGCTVAVFSLTPTDIKTLGQAIIEQAIKIELEAK
jgi:hypothetical protein